MVLKLDTDKGQDRQYQNSQDTLLKRKVKGKRSKEKWTCSVRNNRFQHYYKISNEKQKWTQYVARMDGNLCKSNFKLSVTSKRDFETINALTEVIVITKTGKTTKKSEMLTMVMMIRHSHYWLVWFGTVHFHFALFM